MEREFFGRSYLARQLATSKHNPTCGLFVSRVAGEKRWGGKKMPD
jgi:hypothetical protein